jgi:hypothetical protein
VKTQKRAKGRVGLGEVVRSSDTEARNLATLRGILSAVVSFLFVTSAVHAEVVTIDGTIRSVDTKKRTITVETGSKTLTLDMTSKAKISVEGKEGSLDSLKPGQKIKLSYHDKLEVVLKIEAASNSSPEESTKPSSLFDGETFNGWKWPHPGWILENRALMSTAERGATNISTEDTFEDFEFQCDFWLDKKVNSGIFIRGGYEVQLLDEPSNSKVPPSARCGSIYGRIAPTSFPYRGPKQWNTLSIRLEGNVVTVVLNGKTVIDRRKLPGKGQAAHVFPADQPQPITLQNHGPKACFRNLTIRRLSR